MKTQESSFCQSCGMPMGKPEEHGTDKGGKRSEDYCCYCIKDGEFVVKGVTMEQYIDFLVGMADKMGMTKEEARKMANANIPKLKRWKKK